MSIRIYLIRHGKTKGNLEGRYIGRRTDEGLCDKGTEELSLLKEKYEHLLADVSLGKCALYSSPMKRAVETSKLLFLGCKPAIIDELTEIDFGDFENKNYKELNGNADYQAFIDSGGRTDYPSGERTEDFIKRSLFGLHNVINDMINIKAVNEAVIVCHGGNIMAILSSLTGKDYFDFQVKNGDGYVLELKTGDLDVDSLISYYRL